jgi:RNA recognition motif-containing protein
MSDSDSSPSPAPGGSPLHPPSSGPSEAAEPTPDPAADPAADPSDQPAKKKRKRTKKKKAGAEPAAPDAKDPSTLATPSTLFVEGIPFKITEEAFSSFLASQGCPPTSMRLPVWQDSGNLRGFGHVVFASEAIAKKATDEIGGKNFPALMNRCVRASERASERKKARRKRAQLSERSARK